MLRFLPLLLFPGLLPAQVTTLSRPDIPFRVPDQPWHRLHRGDISMVVVNNEAVDDETLPGHRAGYSGVARLSHRLRPETLFVPSVSGLNFEFIHDGKAHDTSLLFEPRRAPMELRVIDTHTVELYQAPTPFWGLESAQRYHLLPDGTIELTIQCIPRRPTFRNGYIGLFWASYIHQPESLDIHFPGNPESPTAPPRWVRGVSPEHGVHATHLSLNDHREFPHDPNFPVKLMFGLSPHRFAQPWYYGLTHGMAFVQMFRPQDQVRLTQSPTGGGRGNPAWDFQFLISGYQVDRLYTFVMRAAYLPFVSPEQLQADTLPHRRTLGHP